MAALKLYGSKDVWLWQAHFEREHYRENPRKEKRAQLMRDFRRRRDVTGWNRHAAWFRRLSTTQFRSQWMIGYDGPKQTPQSAWPEIAQHVSLYGL